MISAVIEHLSKNNVLSTSLGGPGPVGRQSMASVYRTSSSQSINDNTDTKIEYNAEDFDDLNEFDISTNYRFTASDDGRYLIIHQALLESFSDGNWSSGKIYKNGSLVKFGIIFQGANGTSTSATFMLMELDEDDYIEGWVKHNAGSSKNVENAAHKSRLFVLKVG